MKMASAMEGLRLDFSFGISTDRKIYLAKLNSVFYNNQVNMKLDIFW